MIVSIFLEINVQIIWAVWRWIIRAIQIVLVRKNLNRFAIKPLGWHIFRLVTPVVTRREWKKLASQLLYVTKGCYRRAYLFLSLCTLVGLVRLHLFENWFRSEPDKRSVAGKMWQGMQQTLRIYIPHCCYGILEGNGNACISTGITQVSYSRPKTECSRMLRYALHWKYRS